MDDWMNDFAPRGPSRPQPNMALRVVLLLLIAGAIGGISYHLYTKSSSSSSVSVPESRRKRGKGPLKFKD